MKLSLKEKLRELLDNKELGRKEIANALNASGYSIATGAKFKEHTVTYYAQKFGLTKKITSERLTKKDKKMIAKATATQIVTDNGSPLHYHNAKGSLPIVANKDWLSVFIMTAPHITASQKVTLIKEFC